MTCRICNQPLIRLLTMENMPAMAQHLKSVPEDHSVTLNFCQCSGCGLFQLDNAPVWYWKEEIRTESELMRMRISKLPNADFYSLNRLEHIPCPNEYLRNFHGTGIIEVPNFDMILAKGLYAEIMLDHLMYFTEDTLRFALQYNGFDVQSMESVWNDYILSAVVRKRGHADIAWTFKQKKDKLKVALDNYISQYDTVAIYGASHQAFAYIATLQPRVSFVVDDAPFKQGKYTPIGSLPIYSKEALSNADAVVIMGAGYSDEIVRRLKFEGGVAIMRDWGLEVLK